VNFGEYLVTGKRAYRGHQPGSVFEARLERNAEARAVYRGDIQLLRVITPEVPTERALPAGWTASHGGAANTEGG
jgi:hypothetical protein